MAALPPLGIVPISFDVAWRRIAFLQRFADNAADLLSRDAPPRVTVEDRERPDAPPPTSELREPIPPYQLPGIRALTEAAELAFATDRTSDGTDLLLSALRRMIEMPVVHWPVTRVALAGAVLGEVQTSLTVDGVTLHQVRRYGGPAMVPWQMDAHSVARVAGPLVCAAIASGDPMFRLPILGAGVPPIAGGWSGAARMARLALTMSPELDTLPAFGVARSDDGTLLFDADRAGEQRGSAIAALIALHQRYAARLRLLASDEMRWGTLRLGAPLLDWPLLALHVALRSRRAGLRAEEFLDAIRGAGAASALAVFLYEVAGEMLTGGTTLRAA